MSNNTVAQKPRFSVAIQTEMYQKLINNTLQDPERAKRFIASISSAVAVNPALQDCDAGSILSCALLGESLNLSPSPQLGQYYLVPFKLKAQYDKEGNLTTPERTVATFILGYKGYLQLAMRSGNYKNIIVKAVKKGELIKWDEFNEEIRVNPIDDPVAYEAAETIGYFASFEYLNGFQKKMYWSKDKMLSHAMRYSPAVAASPARGSFPGRISLRDYLDGKAPKGSDWAYSSFWHKDFDGMAFKTMIRQLISRWGIMSIEMRDAFERDDAVIHSDGTIDYISGDDVPQIEGTINGMLADMQVNQETGEIIEGDNGNTTDDSDMKIVEPVQTTLADL